jgi:hypothetical protein
MALMTGQKLQHRLRRLLRLGREDLRVTQPKAGRVVAGAPKERTLRAWESGEVGLGQLHYAVGLGRRSETFRDGLIELMDDRNKAVWWRVPQTSLHPASVVYLSAILGAEPADPHGLLEADMADVTPTQAAAAATIAELEIAVRKLQRGAHGMTPTFMDRLPQELQAKAGRLRAAAAKEESVLRLVRTLPDDSGLKRVLQEIERKAESADDE